MFKKVIFLLKWSQEAHAGDTQTGGELKHCRGGLRLRWKTPPGRDVEDSVGSPHSSWVTRGRGRGRCPSGPRQPGFCRAAPVLWEGPVLAQALLVSLLQSFLSQSHLIMESKILRINHISGNGEKEASFYFFCPLLNGIIQNGFFHFSPSSP